jgi:hypothetical protein
MHYPQFWAISREAVIGRDRIEVGFKTTYASNAYHYCCCEFGSPRREGCTLLCDKGRGFSLTPPVSSTDKSDNHDITKILLKVVLSTIEQTMFRFTSKSPLNIVN